MSILVPFLIFSIGVSHAVQMTNAWKLETLHGADGVTASTHSFAKLFIPGAMALLANALGFMVIAFVDIEIVRELAYTATLGVTVMILTNKMLLPILLSYYSSRPSRRRSWPARRRRATGSGSASAVSRRSRSRWAPIARGARVARVRASRRRAHLQIGDLGKGVPELRAELALQPGRRDDHEPFRDRRRPAAGHRRGEGARARTTRRASTATSWTAIEHFDVPDAPGRRRRDRCAALPGFVKSDHAVVRRDVREVAHAAGERAQIAQGVGYATRLGNEFMNSRCTAMPVSIFTTDHQATTIAAHRREDEGIQGGGRRHRQGPVPARERQRRRHGGDQRGRRSRGQVGQPRAVRRR